MNSDIKQLYETHLKPLGWRHKLELIELLIKATVASLQNEKDKTNASDPKDSYTELQKQLLDGPIMAEEDELLYQEKRQHFAQWK